MTRPAALRGCLAFVLCFSQVPLAWPKDAPLIDTTTTSSGSTVDSRTIDNLPTGGRSFSDLATLAPGVASNKATSQDAFNWDHVPLDGTTAQAIQQHAQALHLDDLASIDIIKAPGAAEFGRTDGGIVNAVTKSGANEFADKAFMPRVGLSWDPFKDGRSTLYANYGRFYESTPMDLGAQTLNQLAGQREWPAAASGDNGLLIATGKSRGKDKTAVIYGANGMPISAFTARDLKQNPNTALDALNYGCELSRISSAKQQLMDEEYYLSGKQRLMREDRFTSGKQRFYNEDRRFRSGIGDSAPGDGGFRMPWPRLKTDGGMTQIDPPSVPISDTPQESVLDDLGTETLPLNGHAQPQGEPTSQNLPDGSSVRSWPDGSREVTRPDGSQDVSFPDGSRFIRQADGTMIDTLPDGTRVTRDKTGKETGRQPGPTPPQSATPPSTGQTPSTGASSGSGPVTDQSIIDATKRQKGAVRDAINQFLTPQGQSTTGGTTPSTGTPTNQKSSAPAPDTGTKPADGKTSTGTSAPAPSNKSTITDQDVIKGAEKLDKSKNVDQKSKDYLKSFLTPQGQQPADGTTPAPSSGGTSSGGSRPILTVPQGGPIGARPRREGLYDTEAFTSRPKDTATQQQSALTSNDFGATLGGPIVKDRLWFWGSGRRNKVELQPQYIHEWVAGLEHEIIPSYRIGLNYTKRNYGQALEDLSADGGSTYFLGGASPQVSGTRPPFSMPQGWMPSNVMILQSGCSASEKPARIDDIYQLWDGRMPRTGRGVYFIDPIFSRTVQAKKREQAPAVAPNDPLYSKSGIVKNKAGEPQATDQWGLPVVGFTPQAQGDSAWNHVDAAKPNTVVAVIDSGLDTAHPDAPEFLWTNPHETPGNGVDDDHDGYVDDVHGWNFLDETSDLTDVKGHGSLVAGIIAAKRNNGIGIAGINPGAQIMVLKVTDQYGKTNSLAIYRAIHYAVDHGARVINLSLGDAGVSQLEQLAVNYAHARGAVIVVAAGNQSGDIAQYGPAALRRVISVGMLKMDGAMSGLSNRGLNVALAAPGEQIYSLHSKDAEWEGSSLVKDRQYFAAVGTSFSAPMVAATASLILAKNPALPNTLVEDIVLDSATPLAGDGWNPGSGWGVLDAAKALTFDANDLLTVRPTELVVTRNAKGVPSVDVLGVIRGRFASYQVSIGKGKQPAEWQAIGDPIAEPIEYGTICHVEGDALARSHDWVVRIVATGAQGRVKTVDVPVTL